MPSMIQAPRRRPHEASGTPVGRRLDRLHPRGVRRRAGILRGLAVLRRLADLTRLAPGRSACGAWPCHPLPCGIGVVGVGTPWVAAAPVASAARLGRKRRCPAAGSATSWERCGCSTSPRPSSGASRDCSGRRTTRKAAGSWANSPMPHPRRPTTPRPARAGLNPGVARVARVARQRLPRRSCSRSIASKSALKLPLPKPSEPCRSISSKKTVGRSPSGLVKICRR